MPPMVVRRVGLAAIKGTRHLSLDEVTLDAHGPLGDRVWCLVDAARLQVVRTVANPLMELSIEADGESLRVALADGRLVSGRVSASGPPVEVDYWGRPALVTPYDGEPARLLAERIGRPVFLARAARGAVVYGAPVSVVGTASLQDLAERMGRPEPVLQPERFRSTLVIETAEPWVEDGWLGRELVVGEVVVRVNGRIGRCGVPNQHPLTGRADTPILKALAGFRPCNEAGEPFLAVDAAVVRPGTIRPGDPVTLLDTP
ncbi:MOSC domain-containing protein [Nocardioides sp. JQ2195]|nr:MOSC domain-containing protein [Nocardioides sp. JQ2195]